MLRCRNNKYIVIDEMLLEAKELLWKDYLKIGHFNVAPHKASFCNFYKMYCLSILSSVISEWFDVYHCESSYKDFYAEKLYIIAKLIIFGEKRPNALRSALQNKPDVKIRFFYDSDEWDKL